MLYEFIIDTFTERRGAPAMLELTCAYCNHYLLTYQKDGPGPLLRCYWDRIHGPDDVKNLIQHNPDDMTLNVLLCRFCDRVIGEKGIYEKEHRLVFILKQDSFMIKQLD